MGSYWLACAQAILSFADGHPEACHLVRYEDLVTGPEETVAGILSFLGERQVPGITRACFEPPHEAGGPADEKLWFTSAVTADSMGRGTVVPAVALPEPARDPINQVLARLGYRAVDDHWNEAAIGTDPRLSPPRAAALRPVPAGGQGRSEVAAAAALITAQLRSQPVRKLREITAYWPALAGQTVEIVVEDGDLRRAELRQTFPAAAAHNAAVGGAVLEPGTDAAAAIITANPATWQSLLAGSTNLITELSAGRIRSAGGCGDHGHPGCIQGHHPPDALRAVAALLGISTIPMTGPVAGTASAG